MRKLPYELIRDILLLSNQQLDLHNQFYHGLHAHGTEYGHGGEIRSENDFLRAIQRQYADYRLISKAIEPIALELLLQDVVLCAFPMHIASFYAFLHAKPHLGAYIRRILLVPLPPSSVHVLLEYTLDHPSLLPQIRKLCPNLTAIETLVRPENTKWGTTDWLTGVEHIAITSGNTSHWSSDLLPSIVATNPRLETLILSARSIRIDSPIHIPTLKRLEIDTVHYTNPDLFTAPLLEACTLSISCIVDTTVANAHAFLQRNGQNLRFLRIMQTLSVDDHYEDVRDYDPTPLSFIHDLAHLCPNLDTIHVLPFYTRDGLTQGPHPTLKTLIIDPHFLVNLPWAVGIWSINENKFANFNTIVFAQATDIHPSNVGEIMQLIKTDPRLFAVTCFITKYYCVPVVVPPCTTKTLAVECARDSAMLAEVAARRTNIPVL